MYRSTRARLGVLVALTACSLSAENVFVFPSFSNATSETISVYSGTPLASVGSFQGSPDVFKVLAKPTNLPSEVKYYIIARGSSNITVLDAQFQPIGTPLNTGQQVIDAVLTPDGKRLYVVSGNNLRAYDTATDQPIAISQAINLFSPESMAVSPDSKQLYIHSSQGQSVQVVDIDTNLLLGPENRISLTLTTQTSIAIGPDGLLYVSAEDKILIYDTTKTLAPSAFIRQIALPTGSGALKPRIGKLQFTPDGTRALAVNNSPQSGHTMFYILLDPLGTRVAALSNSAADFTGAIFEHIAVISNDLAYVATAPTSAQPRRLYRANLPTGLDVNGLLPFPELVSGEFGSLGSVAATSGLTTSGEYPKARRLYVNAPLSLTPNAAPGTPNKVYEVDLAPSTPNVRSELTINFIPSLVGYAGPANTLASGASANGILRYGAPTSELPTSSRSQPFGVRVVDAAGRPMFNMPVTFTVASGPATINGASTLFTNASGFVMTSVNTGSTAGDATVNVAVQSTGLTAGFTFRVSTNPGGNNGGGGDGGGNGSGGSGRIILLEGEGVIVKEGDFSDLRFRDAATGDGRTKLRVIDSQDRPVANTVVTWAVVSGGGRWVEGAPGETTDRVTTVTDALGETSNVFIAPGSGTASTQAFVQSVASASTANASTEIHFITIPAFSDNNPTPFPSFEFLMPRNEPISVTGQAGTVVKDAIQVRFTSAGGNFGAAIPNVGVHINSRSADPNTGPAAVCDPRPVASSNELGVATCDLRLLGKSGETTVRLRLGGYAERLLRILVTPGDPNVIRIVNGDNQTARPGERALANLVIEVGDGGGNNLPGASVRWEVIQGTATLDNSTTITDQNGRTFNGIRFGNTPGNIQVRATALSGTRPSATFNFRVSVVVSGIAANTGNNQTTFINTNFAQPVSVRVTDAQSNPVNGAVVNFTLVSGSATLSAPSATTDQNGIAQVTVRAGERPGPIVVQASAAGITQLVTFNLTSQLPGPQINRLDFFNAASNERGAVVPGSVYTITGVGIAPDLKGCVQSNPVLGVLPTRLGGVEVQFGAFLAPLFSVCNTDGRESITLQVPFELAGQTTVNVTARVGAGSSVINGVEITTLQPGVFETTDTQGRRFAVALRPDGSFVTPDNPARYGEIVRVFMTGGGQVTPSARTGVTGVTGQVMNVTPSVGLSESGVRLISATYAVGMVGVYEVAFEVPQGTPTGSARSLGVILSRPDGQFVFPGNSPTIAIAP
ncbi:MAG: Ig-like domain-containing protein [Bryobacteraceae bacterium]